MAVDAKVSQIDELTAYAGKMQGFMESMPGNCTALNNLMVQKLDGLRKKLKKAEQMASEADEEDEDGVPFDRKKEVILAIADPDMSVDDIIEKFFKKDMTDEQRKMVSDHIAKVRVEQADKLQRLREHTDENGNYKA